MVGIGKKSHSLTVRTLDFHFSDHGSIPCEIVLSFFLINLLKCNTNVLHKKTNPLLDFNEITKYINSNKTLFLFLILLIIIILSIFIKLYWDMKKFNEESEKKLLKSFKRRIFRRLHERKMFLHIPNEDKTPIPIEVVFANLEFSREMLSTLSDRLVIIHKELIKDKVDCLLIVNMINKHYFFHDAVKSYILFNEFTRVHYQVISDCVDVHYNHVIHPLHIFLNSENRPENSDAFLLDLNAKTNSMIDEILGPKYLYNYKINAND